MTLPLLLITGGTGFVGSHIILQAIEAGYPVRALSRPAKADSLRAMYGSKIDIVLIDDIATADFTEALKGVGAVIHVAAPLPGKESLRKMLKMAVGATIRLLSQATEAGVSRFILTSSVATVVDYDSIAAGKGPAIYTEKDWNPAEIQEDRQEGWYAYQIGKTITEQEVWKFAEEHPEIDVTCINPCYVYGPFVPGFQVKSVADMATVGYVYQHVLSGTTTIPLSAPWAAVAIDARDSAKAHILALTAPSTATLGKRKRFVINGENWWFDQAITHLQSVRPELAPRLPDVSEVLKLLPLQLDNSFAAEVLGLKEYIDWRKTVEDMVDSLIAVEKQWHLDQNTP